MDCQSGCPLKPLIAPISEKPTWIRGACPGQCLNVGMDGRTHATKILTSTKNAVLPVWPNECNLPEVLCPSSHCTRI